MNRPPSASIAELSRSCWDLIVIGAGLAGTVSAILTARAGRRVLIVDAKAFPRDKVCGCCFNERALSILSAAGLDGVRDRLPGIPLRRVEFVNGDRTVPVNARGGIAISRSTLDQALVDAAIEAGATFRPGCSARLLPLAPEDRTRGAATPDARHVRLTSTAEEAVVAAKCVAVADGLNRRSASDCVDEFPYRIHPRSWIGLGAMVAADALAMPSGLLRMVIGRSGYVGAVRVEGGRASLAAAVSADFVRDEQSPGEAIAALFNSSDPETTAAISGAKWTGTGRLTRSSLKIAGHRTLLIGDAAGYVEPITGEGMSWALASALEAAPLLSRGVDSWSSRLAEEWEDRFRRRILSRRLWCNVLSRTLRNPRLVSGCLSIASRFPILPRLISAGINQPVTRWNTF
ncbi:MAG: NAD(P)/FAD-dependent oxidoreductase [Isosphaeraceae bacterium]|nr:NAD(P)/FAD-dependent oxidoreductase [Isosphaeraceae bacterium]